VNYQPQQFRVVGLDLSVTSTGMSDGLNHEVVQPPPDMTIERRLNRVADRVGSFVAGFGGGTPADLVVIEAGAFSRGAQSVSAEWLAALRYHVRIGLWRMGIPFAMVPPTTLKAYTTGSGKATKKQMVDAVRARHDIDLSGRLVKDGRYDVADAVALAAMGYAYLNDPLYTQGPPPPMRSLLAVKWPDRPDPYREG
jgi:Holliday junction resolvasome RuvABC endonuclease subunit